MGGGWPRPPLLTKLSISRIVGEQISRLNFETLVCRDRSKGQLGGPFKTMSHAGSLSCHFGGEGGGRGEAQIEGSWIPVQINEYGH